MCMFMCVFVCVSVCLVVDVSVSVLVSVHVSVYERVLEHVSLCVRVNTGCFAGKDLFQSMIRTFGLGPRAQKRRFLCVWDRTSGENRRQIPGEV